MFKCNAFVVSGTDIPNVNPEVYIQHVAEIFVHSVRTVVALNAFHVMGIVTTTVILEHYTMNARGVTFEKLEIKSYPTTEFGATEALHNIVFHLISFRPTSARMIRKSSPLRSYRHVISPFPVIDLDPRNPNCIDSHSYLIMRQGMRQLHLTGKYQKCLSATLLQTSQREDLECERNTRR